MGGWVVMISGPEMLEDLRKATDDQISFVDAVKEVSNYLILLSNVAF